MIRAPRLRQPAAPCQLNLTALLDVVLQLIVFFILVSQLGLEDHPELNLANPEQPQVQRAGQDHRLIVNLLAAGAEAASEPASAPTDLAAIQIGQATFNIHDMAVVTEFLAGRLETDPDLRVLVRADAALPFHCVRPVLEALRTAGAHEIGLVTRAAGTDANS
jgi:biopolymer transport protein ExbD